MFTDQEIREDPTFAKFLRKKKGIAKSTIKTYIFALKSFCNYTNKTPSEIYNLHKSDLMNHVPEFDMWLTDALEDWVSNEIDKGNLYKGIKNRLTLIKSFFHAFRLRPTPLIEINMKDENEDVKYRLTIEDIRKAIKHSSPTYQCIFTVQAQTGLAIADVVSLDIEDFILAVSGNNEKIVLTEAIHRVKKNKTLIGCFDMRRKKTSNQFYTFIGHEALLTIAQLLENRNEQFSVPKSPIFLRETSHLTIAEKEKINTLEDMRLKAVAVKNYLDRMHENCRGKKRGRGIFPQITVGGKHRNFFRTHKIRAWYSDQLRFKAGFSAEDTKYLMGQTTGDVLERYIDTNNYNALKQKYKEALPYLSINETVKLEVIDNSDELTRLKVEKDQEIAVLEKRLEQMNERNKLIDEKLNKILTNETVLEELNKR